MGWQDGIPVEQAANAQPAWMQGKPVAEIKPADPEQGTDRAALLSSIPMRLAKGLKDTIDGPAQSLSEAVPGAVNRAGDAVTEGIWSIPVVGPFLKNSGLLGVKPSEVSKDIQQSNAEYEQARQTTAPKTLRDLLLQSKADPGFDAARFAGNVLGPGNRLIPGGSATTTLGRAGMGAVQGAAAAAIQPVTAPGDYATAKATQIGVGGLAGGILAPVIGKVTDVAAVKLGALADKFKTMLSPRDLEKEADIVIKQEFAAQGIDISTLPKNILDSVKADVQTAMKAGKLTKPEEIVRKADFAALDMQPTAGQITRDPTQFAQEKNLRGIVGAGEPLANRFNQQNAQLIDNLNTRGAAAAPGALQTSEAVMGKLSAGDAARKAATDALYSSARDSEGRAAALNPQAFATAANDALDSGMLGHTLPGQARAILNDVATGKIPLNVNTAEQIKTVLGSMSRGASVTDAERLALSKVRDALDNTPVASQMGEDAIKAFNLARGAHSVRMQLQEKVPALAAAVEKEAPDKFFQKYVLGGDVRDLKALSGVLKKEAPDAIDQIKAQIVDHLKTKALNQANDEVGIFSQSAYNKALDNLTDKLPAFFSKQEIADLQRVGRVSSYIQAQPAGAAVNNSNTASAAMNLLSKIGKVPKVGGYVNSYLLKPLQNSADQAAVDASLAAKLSTKAPETSSATIRALLDKGRYPLVVGAGAAIGAQQ